MFATAGSVRQVFAAFYPAPKEGTNTLDLAEGWKLKGVYKLDRKIDEAALPAVTEQLREMGVNADTLVKWSPDLKTATYKELTAEEREEQLIKAFKTLQGRNERGDFTGQGIPAIPALKKLVEFSPEKKEVETLWTHFIEEQASA